MARARATRCTSLRAARRRAIEAAYAFGGRRLVDAVAVGQRDVDGVLEGVVARLRGARAQPLELAALLVVGADDETAAIGLRLQAEDAEPAEGAHRPAVEARAQSVRAVFDERQVVTLGQARATPAAARDDRACASTRMARVRRRRRASTSAGSSTGSSGATMSASTGRPPARATSVARPGCVSEGMMTSSPRCSSRLSRARCMAAAPPATGTIWLLPKHVGGAIAQLLRLPALREPAGLEHVGGVVERRRPRREARRRS